jgi:glutaryl-CoA dehydrogenase
MTEERLYAQSDQYGYESLLSDPERAHLRRLRRFLENEAAPLLVEHWEAGTFPTPLIPSIAALDIVAPSDILGGSDRVRSLFAGFRTFEWARTDASLNTYFGAHAGLFRHIVIDGGSAEQIARWDPDIRSFGMTGCFALTEPDSGSDIARGLATRAERDGDTWTLTGRKRWIGNAPLATHLAVFARDAADGGIKCFVVPAGADGLQIDTIRHKTALRMVQNGDIVLDGVRVREEDRLQGVNSFRDVARVLRYMRSDVGWVAAGTIAGAYEAAREYVLEREQFGRPLASFQLVQSHLSAILGDLTGCLSLMVGLAQRQDAGVLRDEDSALAKSWVTTRMREALGRAREIVGGNGILLDHRVARFHADGEAIYTYEGTKEINDLVLGRAITGISAFD